MTGSPLLQCRHVNKYRGKQTLSSRGVSCLHTHWLTEGLGDNTPSLGASFPWRLKPVSFSILYMWLCQRTLWHSHFLRAGAACWSLTPAWDPALSWPLLLSWSSDLHAYRTLTLAPCHPQLQLGHQLSVAVHTLGWHISEWVLDPWETFLTNWKGTLTGTWEMHDVLRGPNPAWWRASPWTQLCS